jgi:hypothetical protein
MPTYARSQIVLEDQVGVYHCIARCVRRAFVSGVDPYTGQDFLSKLSWFMRCLREKTEWKRCAALVGCSNRRRGDRACLSMPRHAAPGAGSRVRRRPEWPFCRPPALDAETSTDISMTL